MVSQLLKPHCHHRNHTVRDVIVVLNEFIMSAKSTELAARLWPVGLLVGVCNQLQAQ